MVAVGTIVALAACGGTSSSGSNTSSTPTPQADVGSGQLVGDGSSFDEPFLTKAFYQYNQDHPSVSVNYGAHGSGAGIAAFQAGTVDFGATDVPMGAADIAKADESDFHARNSRCFASASWRNQPIAHK